jgi:hypothetical protein
MTLLNDDYVRSVIHREARWAVSHGSDEAGYLGGGLLYYTLAYMSRAKLCVCLGSGGGFVPRLMRQAQRDLGLEDARTVLVDADIGLTASAEDERVRARLPGRLATRRKWGRPQWVHPDSFFRTAFPDIEILIRLTKDVAAEYAGKWQIDYLHIDADFSYEGRLADFYDYAPLMAPHGFITCHDTNGALPCGRALDDLKAAGHEVVNFPDVGRGVALVRLARPPRSDSVQGVAHAQHVDLGL